MGKYASYSTPKRVTAINQHNKWRMEIRRLNKFKYNLYVDYRNDNNKVIYVGIGSNARVKLRKRNRKHTGVDKKYGITREILFKTNDYPWLQIQEILAIKYFNTYVYDNINGCNFTKGADGGVGYQHTIKTKRTLSNISACQIATEETKRKISNSCKKLIKSEETKLKSAISKGAKSFNVFKSILIKKSNHYDSPSIYKKGKFIGTWINQHKCARNLNIARSGVNNCLNKHRPQYAGYIFEFS